MILERLLAGIGWRIAEPTVLAGLLAVVLGAAVAGALGIWRRWRALRRSYGRLGRIVAPGATPAPPVARLALTCCGLALLAVAAARPQAGLRVEQAPAPGVDLVVVLDASRSMLARDVAPDRLTLAKREVASLLDRLPGVRVAVVAFAGSAQLRAPLTADVPAAKLLLEAVDSSTMPLQGTDVASALEAAARALAPTDDGGARVALLVGDGEDHGAGAAQAAERLALARIPLFTGAVGTASGAPVPGEGGRALVDGRGAAVVSRLHEEQLEELAARGGGRHVRLDGDGAGIAELAKALSRVEGQASRTARVGAWDERFAGFALPGLLLLAAAAATPERRRRGGRARRAAPLVAAGGCVMLLAGAAPFLAEHEGLAEANALAARDPEAALRLMDAVEREVGPRAEIDVNRGIALFRAGRVAEARRAFSLGTRAPRPLASRAVYAEGVAALAGGDEAAALSAWRRALVLDPANGAARFNLEVLLRRGAEPPRTGASAPVELSRGEESGARDEDRVEREGSSGESARRDLGDAAANGGRGDRSAPDAPAELDSTPMSPSDAERLLDAVAAGERAMPVAPARGPRVEPEKAW